SPTASGASASPRSSPDSRREGKRLALRGFALRLTVAALFIWTPLLAQERQWLMYSGSYSSHRFSPLRQISTENVAQLHPVWVYQPPGTGSIECTPVVANGVMYVTSGPTS